MTKIPPSVIGTASPILADAYTHAQLNVLFMAAGSHGTRPPTSPIWRRACGYWTSLMTQGAFRETGAAREASAFEFCTFELNVEEGPTLGHLPPTV
jgi:hypothetical protein